ncbi:ATP-binding cassette domain-containing protein [Streptomyces sp. NPDC001508]|uniref:ATP-binding cassette domain-containing protein n=1 Tax=Streptomyces sp. NPDC001508 TaxID=3154656 RepID=UPI00332D10F7
MNTLSIRGLSKSFHRHLRQDASTIQVLRGVDLDLEQGTCTALTGASGSGKTSLLRCVWRTYRPTDGTITLRTPGRELDLARADDQTVLSARRSVMSSVTQFLDVIPRVPAVDLVASRGTTHEGARDLLRRVGLPEELADQPPATFSGGQKQLVNIAMGLAAPGRLLLLDEITASLDRARRSDIRAVLRHYKDAGVTMLAVVHDSDALGPLVDRVVELRDGKVLTA